MLVRIFKSNQRAVSVLTLFILLLLWIPSFLYADAVSGYFGLYWLDRTFGFLLIAFQAIFINYMVNEFNLLNTNNYLTSLLFVSINCMSFYTLTLTDIYIANTLLTIAFYQLLKLHQAQHQLALLFNAGLLVGLATIFYLPCSLFFLYIWLVTAYVVTPKWRDLVIAWLGFLLPLIYFSAYFYLIGDLAGLQEYLYPHSLFSTNLGLLVSTPEFIYLSCLVLVGGYVLLKTMQKRVVRVRKMVIMVFLFLLFSALTLVVTKGDGVAALQLMSMPIAIILANFFQQLNKSWLAELLYFFLVVMLVMGYFS